VSAARRRLAAFGLQRVLINERGKYRLAVPPALVDVHGFHVLTDQARDLTRDGDQRAVAVLEQALKLRLSEPLSGLGGDWVDGYRQTLTGELQGAEQDLYENAIRHGGAHGRLPGLAALYRDHPGNERVTWLYMHALYRTGQQEKALAVKQELDRHLRDEGGLDSGQALNDLYQRILNKDDALLTPEAVAFPAGETGARTRRLGRPGPRAAQENQQEQQERTAYQGEKHADPAGAGIPTVSNVFHERVDATYAVFGPQINYGAPR
jgi:DNA-binding SARP family transcriptional activator